MDALAGGFPCQPVSQAGHRRAQDDARWLWPEFARCVRELRPKYVLVENVPGLLARGLGDVLSDLAAVGYDAEWDCMGAAHFGAHHLRDRLWLVAYPDRLGWQARRIFDAGPPAEGSPLGAASPADPRWTTEPSLARVAYGIPGGMAQRRALGDALIPAIAEAIGRRVLEAE